MSDFGPDVSTFPDLDPMFEIVTGNQVIAEAILRRLTTTREGLFYDSDYGLDVRAWLNESLVPKRLYLLQRQIEAECEKDERVLSADATISLNPEAHRMTVFLVVDTSEETFKLTLGIDQVSASILAIE